MLIDKLNREAEERLLFPFDIYFPLVIHDVEANLFFVGHIFVFEDDIPVMFNPQISNHDSKKYVPLSVSSYEIDTDEELAKVKDSDAMRLAYPYADFNLGMINGIPFTFSTRIH